MIRSLQAAVLIVAAVVIVLAAILWVRSYWIADWIFVRNLPFSSQYGLFAFSGAGRLRVSLTPPRSDVWHAHSWHSFQEADHRPYIDLQTMLANTSLYDGVWLGATGIVWTQPDAQGAPRYVSFFFGDWHVIALALLLGCAGIPGWRRRRRLAQGRCVRCGYQLAGAAICSECGTPSRSEPKPNAGGVVEPH